MSHEEWRPVVGYGGRYEVSDQGRVRSLCRTSPIILNPYYAKTGGYPTVNISRERNGKQTVRKVHHLVLEAFVGPRPFPKANGRHLNDVPTDCRLENLEWGSSSDNKHDAVRNGRNKNASKTCCKWGHEFTPENTISFSRGGRGCRECHKRRSRESDLRKRGAVL